MKKTDSQETIQTTDSMKKKGKLCSRLVINMLKIFRICTTCKSKPKSKWRKSTKNKLKCFFTHYKNQFVSFWSSFCSTTRFLGGTLTFCNFFVSRRRFLKSFSFSFGHVMLAAFIAALCSIFSFFPLDNFFRVFSTWANQSLLNVVILILILIKKVASMDNHIYGGVNLSFSAIRLKFEATPWASSNICWASSPFWMNFALL